MAKREARRVRVDVPLEGGCSLVLLYDSEAHQAHARILGPGPPPRVYLTPKARLGPMDVERFAEAKKSWDWYQGGFRISLSRDEVTIELGDGRVDADEILFVRAMRQIEAAMDAEALFRRLDGIARKGGEQNKK